MLSIKKLITIHFLLVITISGLQISGYGQEMTLEEVQVNLLANPPEIGDSAIRRACFEVLDEKFKSSTASTDAAIRNFYNKMLEQFTCDFYASESALAVIYKMYNHGFIIKMQDLVVAIDLVRGMSAWKQIPTDILKEIDVALVTHEHSDHFDNSVLYKVKENGGTVIIPTEMSYSGAIQMSPGDSVIISGVTIKAYDGLHGDTPMRIYEIISPLGIRIMHTGDNQASYTLPDVKGVDILLLNSWVNESDGNFSNVLGMQYCLEKLEPELMIPGHCNELTHSPDQRYPYDSVFTLLEKNIPSDVVVMAWGERFEYKPGSVLPIQKTQNEIQIDGVMDDAWSFVPETPMQQQLLDTPDDWFDLYGTFRSVWDNENIFFFLKVHDDVLRTDNPDAWNNDVIELFFDGDNSKNSTTEGYDEDDLQMRFEYMKGAWQAPNSEYVFLETDHGYNFEARIPESDLHFDLDTNLLIGLDVQVSDNDDGTQNSIIRWWSDNMNNYQDPSLFGTAKLVSTAKSEIKKIQYTPSPIIIDAAMDYSWLSGDLHPINNLIFGEEHLSSPNDAYTTWKVLWDENYLYYWIEVTDDILFNDSESEFYNDDCIEFWIDGDNSKGNSHDNVNDFGFQLRYHPGLVIEPIQEGIGPGIATSQVKQAAKLTEKGFVVEIGFPLDLLGIEPYDSTYIGFDIDYNDDDDGGICDTKFKCIALEDAAWQTPFAWGTAMLIGSGLKKAIPEAIITAPVKDFVTIYPNPVNSQINLSFTLNKPSDVLVSINDISGKTIKTFTLTDVPSMRSLHSLDISHLVKGIYFVTVQTEDISWSQRFVKK